MSTLLKLTGPNHEAMIKEAIIGQAAVGVGSLMGRVGKAVVKNPLKSLGYAFTGSDLVSRANRMGSAASEGANLAANVGRITM